MAGLVIFEIGMFTLTKCKQIEPEAPPTRTEKSEGTNRGQPSSPGVNKSDQSPKNQAATKSQSPAKGQAATTNKQEEAAKKAEKAQAKAAAAAAK